MATEHWQRPSSAERGERRVVITGMGAVTPIGKDVPSFWDSLVAGRSGIDRISVFDPSKLDAQIAGEVKGFEPELVMPKKEVRRHDRYVHFAWAASHEALRDAGLPNPIEDDLLAERTGVIIGSGIGGINTMIRDIIEAHDLGIERIGPFLVTSLIPDMGAGYVAIYANARGPNYATVSACSSANHAIGDAANIIRRGDADVMIAGGAEAGIGEIPIAAFAAMRALSTDRNDEPQKACRPFDAGRDGFVMSEGAGMLVLEDARARHGPRRPHPRRARRLRGDRRRIARHAAGAGRTRRRRPACGSPWPTPGCARGYRLHQRPRHQHGAQRQGRDGRHQDRLRRAMPTRSRSAAPSA